MGSIRFFANIRPLESTSDNNRERARLLQMPPTLAATRGALTAISLLWSLSTAAGPGIAPGDIALRHDIQRLADPGVITGPISTWPLAWGPIAADVFAVDGEVELPAGILQSLARVRARANRETRIDDLRFDARLSVAEKPSRMRSFADTPRETGEIGAGIAWTGERFSVSLSGQIVDSPADGKDYRADGSEIAIALGNFSLSANTFDRWWGPGWDSSLILSSNARPLAAMSIDRNFTDPFASRWLSWLGPWDLAVHFGQFESDRHVPDARFFGMRFNFRPIPSLEIGISRTAQWCGDGRPCGLDTFIDLLLGKDNVGDEGIDAGNEPGNQLAGIDVRWTSTVFTLPIAVYGQFIGEDEAGGFPSHYLGQLGLEVNGILGTRWSYRWFGEFAGTSCAIHQSNEIFNCAYNHGVYQTGYRYRGRAVGHTSDNDSRIISAGLMLLDGHETQWQVLVRYGGLNRGGPADSRNSLTPTRQDIASLDLTHRRLFTYGHLEIGVGIERTDDESSGETRNDGRAFLQWRSSH